MRKGTRTYRPAAIGMMYGLWIGAAIGALVFVVTKDPLWFGLAGVGVAFGLSIGAAFEGHDDPSGRKGSD